MLQEYGPQGWWPVRCECALSPPGEDPRWQRGYHPGLFGHPRTRQGRWEIVAGALLTQNTAWRNVEQALTALSAAGLDTPDAVQELEPDQLAPLIRPAGYYNQKARYLLAAAEWFQQQDPHLSREPPSALVVTRARPILLAVRGVGPETADSILLYAYSLPTFVIDAYTRRVFGRLGAVEAGADYESLRTRFARALIRETDQLNTQYWQEAHALIVEHAKRHHGPGRDGSDDPLRLVHRTRPQRA